LLQLRSTVRIVKTWVLSCCRCWKSESFSWKETSRGFTFCLTLHILRWPRPTQGCRAYYYYYCCCCCCCLY